MQLLVWFLVVTFLQLTVGQNTESPVSNNVGICANLESNMYQHHWVVDHQLHKLVKEIDGNQKSITERLSRLEKLEEIMSKNRNATSAWLEQAAVDVSNHLQNYRFGLVKPPSCPTLESNLNSQSPELRVYCEMSSLGGGWIVIQQRLDGSVNFNRTWTEYRDGFGTAGKSTEFWLGLEAMHWITNSAEYELTVEVKDEQGKYAYVSYSHFRVASEVERYWLKVEKQLGMAYDGLSFVNTMDFSTFDNGFDIGRGCAKEWSSGWWYLNIRNRGCTNSNLNSPYIKSKNGHGIEWNDFTKAGTSTRMMIRLK